jgi:hypothetical protein
MRIIFYFAVGCDLFNGSSLLVALRIVDVSINTVTKLLLDVGRACEMLVTQRSLIWKDSWGISTSPLLKRQYNNRVVVKSYRLKSTLSLRLRVEPKIRHQP